MSLGVNDFIGSDGSKIAALRNENGFCSIINEFDEQSQRNFFKVDMLVTKVTRVEANPEKNIEKDYATISGCVFGYGPKIIPATFIMKNEKGIKYFENLDVSNANPTFTNVWGEINCSTEKIIKKEESAFGEAAVQVYDKKVKEYVITGSKPVLYDFGDEDVLTKEDVMKMSQERQVMLAEIEKRYNESKAKKAAKSTTTATTVPDGDFVF